MTKFIRSLAIFLVSTLISTGLTLPCEITSRLSGTVCDPTEAVIIDSSVILKNLTEPTTWTAKTDSEGRFEFNNLSPGRYELTVESLGFEKHIGIVSVDNESDRELKVTLRPHQCPDPVKRLSEAEKQAKRFCEVHHKKMRLDIVPIAYGLVVLDVDMNVMKQEFPNANRIYYGGCIIDCYKKAEVLYCPSCRSAESRRDTLRIGAEAQPNNTFQRRPCSAVLTLRPLPFRAG